MIFIERPGIKDVLDEPAREHLKQKAAGAAALASGSSLITSRWNSFTQGKGKDEPHGPKICETIKSYCREKCVYCEAPAPRTIDHFWPKTEYPAKMFDWDNLIAACRDCNSDKRAEFKLNENQEPLMIDPTSDEPLAYFKWNFKTGRCEYAETDVRANENARRIEMDRLCTERLEKLNWVRFLFAICIREKPISTELRERLNRELDASRPYLCILRTFFLCSEKARDTELVRLTIAAVPEILDWVKPWLHPPVGVKWPP